MRSSGVGCEDVGKAHELDELEQLAGRGAELDAAVPTLRSELEARERIDRHGIRSDSRDVAGDDPTASGEDGAHALADARQIRTRDRSATTSAASMSYPVPRSTTGSTGTGDLILANRQARYCHA